MNCNANLLYSGDFLRPLLGVENSVFNFTQTGIITGEGYVKYKH